MQGQKEEVQEMCRADSPEQRGPEGARQLMSKGHKVNQDQGMESRAPTTGRLLMSKV